MYQEEKSEKVKNLEIRIHYMEDHLLRNRRNETIVVQTQKELQRLRIMLSKARYEAY